VKFKNIITSSLLILTLLCAGSAVAEDWFWGLTYETAVPTGDVKEFCDDGWSWRGIGFEGRTWLNRNVSAGFATSWNVFHVETDWVTQSEPGLDVTSKQFRDVNSVPLYVNSHYYMGDPYETRFYLGLNAGAMYSERRADVGSYTFKEDNWMFSVAPEIGVQLPYTSFLGYLSVRWNYGFAAGSFEETSYFSFRFGVGLR